MDVNTLKYFTFEQNTPTKANFTNFEKEFITELVMKHHTVLENKRNDSVMCRQKNATWAKLTEEFNNFDPKITKRTTKQLKKCWENLKTRAKKASLERDSSSFTIDDNSIEVKTETIVEDEPEVADIIALQLKPIGDVIKPLDNEDDSSRESVEAIRTSSDGCTQTPIERAPPISKPYSKITVIKPHTSSSILAKLSKPSISTITSSNIKPPPASSTSTTFKVVHPVSSIKTATSSTSVKTVLPSSTSSTSVTSAPTVLNPILRQSLSTSLQERQLQEEEQRLKVQFLKRKLEMAESEHEETISLIRAKRQYVELKKQQLMEKSSTVGNLNESGTNIKISNVVGNADMCVEHFNETITNAKLKSVANGNLLPSSDNANVNTTVNGTVKPDSDKTDINQSETNIIVTEISDDDSSDSSASSSSESSIDENV